MMTTLREVLSGSEFPNQAWLFLPENEIWSLESRSFLGPMEEVPPEDEMKDKAGYPSLMLEKEMLATLEGQAVQSIVASTRQQKQGSTAEDIFEAFLYYYDNDAFKEWK
jgi:hypothetical protein